MTGEAPGSEPDGRRPKRAGGCGAWLAWLVLAVFVGECLWLWMAARTVPDERLPQTVLTVVVAAIITGSAAFCLRVQRRMR